MNDDMTMIVHRYPESMTVLRVYALGDVHVGSPVFDDKAIRRKIQIIREDPFAVVHICGDLGDYGLKNSLTNVYQATMQPKEQKEYIYELFKPIAEKITTAVPGNHEERILKEVGTCPLYDLCVMWGIPEAYRENMAITKYRFGKQQGHRQQNAFVGLTTHGASRARHKKFIACFDGIDFAISGHTHTPEYSPHGKIRVNMSKETVAHVPYKEIVVDAHMKPGSYAVKKEYEIPPPPELQYLELSSYREHDDNRTNHKTMSYHAIQI